MNKGSLIEDYLKRINSELFGLDQKARMATIEEIRTHLKEKSMEAAREKGLKDPDDATYSEMLKEFGSPYDVAREYFNQMKMKMPTSIKLILSYCIFIGILDLLIMLFYFRDAYWEAIYDYTDHSYMWVSIAVGSIYGIMGATLGVLSVMQLRGRKRIYYMGTITLIITVFSMVAAIFGGISQQIMEYEFNIDLWYYPNNLIVAAAALIPIILFLVSLPIFERFKHVIEVKEENPARILKLRKRSQTMVVSTSVVFLIVLGLLGAGLFDHEKRDEHSEWESVELVNIIEVKSGVTIEIWNSYGPYMDTEYRIVYEEDGRKVNRSFFPDLMGALDWLSNNSDPDDKVLSWWDYGYPIEGYTGLESIIDKPARYIEQTIWDPSSIEEWSEDENRIKDVASALIAIDPSNTISVMEKYDADFVFTNSRDQYGILYALVLGAGENPDDYFEYDQGEKLTELGKNTVVHRIWKGDEIPGFELVYSDLQVRILKRV